MNGTDLERVDAAISVLEVRTAIAQRAFLQAFQQSPNVRAAARLAGVGRRTHYDWLARDEQYARTFRELLVSLTR